MQSRNADSQEAQDPERIPIGLKKVLKIQNVIPIAAGMFLLNFAVFGLFFNRDGFLLKVIGMTEDESK